MDTWIWGPIAWRLLEDISYRWDIDQQINNHSKQEHADMTLFLQSLKYVLPCVHCRRHYGDNINKSPFEQKLRQGTLFRWIYELHELVNSDTLKQTYSDRVQVNLDPEFKHPVMGFVALLKKLEVYSQNCSISNLIDLLYIISDNLYVIPQDMKRSDKIMWHIVFLQCLPKVIAKIPTLSNLSIEWKTNLKNSGISEKDIVESDQSMVSFLNKLDRKNLTPQEPGSVAQTIKRYNKACANYVPDTKHWYPEVELTL